MTKESKRGESSQTKGTRSVVKTTVRFREDDQYVEMEAEGLDTDFPSENEDDNVKDGRNEDSSDDDEITFSPQETEIQENNNAIADPGDNYEEWECSLGSTDSKTGEMSMPGPKAVVDSEAEKLIDQKINKSFDKVQTFSEQKFTDLTKILELQNQLAENHRQLEVLKARGKQSSSDQDNSSKITIYHNAVEKKWDSSSSEDNYMDTSAEQFVIPDNTMTDVSIVERELEKNSMSRKGEMPEESAKTNATNTENLHQEFSGANGWKPVEEKADHMVREAEQSMARLYDVKGKIDTPIEEQINWQIHQVHLEMAVREGLNETRRGVPSVLVDEDYLLVASHLDQTVCQKIEGHQYVDFAKLLKRDKSEDENSQKMTLINKGGYSYWVPMNVNQCQLLC